MPISDASVSLVLKSYWDGRQVQRRSEGDNSLNRCNLARCPAPFCLLEREPMSDASPGSCCEARQYNRASRQPRLLLAGPYLKAGGAAIPPFRLTKPAGLVRIPASRANP